MNLREITLDDIPAYCRMLGEVYSESGAYLASLSPGPQEVSEKMRSFMLHPSAPFIFIVAEFQSELLGWIDVVPYPFEALRHCANLSLGVRREMRNRGIGSALIQEALLQAKRSALELIHLETFASNQKALLLYQKFGFQVEGLRKKAKKCPHSGAYDDIILMTKRL